MLIKILSLKKFSRNKELLNIGLFSIANFISVFGTSIYNFAISLYVLKITGSGLNFAMTLVIGALSTVIVNPFAGVLADKINKKLLAVITDILNGMLLFVLYIITSGHPLNLSMIYLSTFILNVFSNIYGISIETAKPNLVSEKKLLQINSISKIIESASSILGPIIGGMIFSLLDIRLFIIINSFSFGMSALLQLFIDFLFNHNNEQREEEKINIFTDIIHGVTYLRSKKDILNMFGIFIALNFFIGLSINVPVPYIVNNILKLSSNLFGIIQGFFSMGMIFGALIIRKALNKFSHQKIVKLMTNILSICMIAIGLSVIMQYKIYDNNNLYVIYFCSIMLLTGISISLVDIAIFYELQQTIPDAIRGRVLSIGISIAKITLPIALIIAGSLINLIPAYILPIISGVGLWIFTMLYVRND